MMHARKSLRQLGTLKALFVSTALVANAFVPLVLAQTPALQSESAIPAKQPAVPPSGKAGSTTQPQGESGVIPQADSKDQPSPAQNTTTPQLLPDRVGVNSAEQVPITLDEAIARALASNRDITAARIDVEIAGFDLKAARGIYDPRLSSESYFERRDIPVASIIGGGANGQLTQSDLTGTARLAGASPFFGGSYQIDFSSARQTTNNVFSSLSPQFPSALTLSYTQPLLRGLRVDDSRRRIEIAKKNLTLSDSQFRQRAIEVITRVQLAYWDLVFALRNLQVQLDAVGQSRTQVESNRRKVDEGMLAPIDVIAAEIQVATFEQFVHTAQEGVTRAENTLKTLMLPDRGAEMWSRALLPVSPVTVDVPRLPLDQAVAAALANRPELEQLKTSAGINEINTRFFDDQTKPQIDLVGAYTSLGLAGDIANSGPNPFTASSVALQGRVNELSRLAGLPDLPPQAAGSLPDSLIGGPEQSLKNLLGMNFPTARVGVRFSLPVGNRTAEANLGRSLAEGRRITNQREQAEQLIEADVRNAMQAVLSAQARLAAAAAARSWSEQQYESERRRFDAGMSTVFLVLERHSEMIAARGRELQTQTDLNKAIADYHRSTGTTLAVNKVTVRVSSK